MISHFIVEKTRPILSQEFLILLFFVTLQTNMEQSFWGIRNFIGDKVNNGCYLLGTCYWIHEIHQPILKCHIFPFYNSFEFFQSRKIDQLLKLRCTKFKCSCHIYFLSSLLFCLCNEKNLATAFEFVYLQIT